jgi:hypothetical protein
LASISTITLPQKPGDDILIEAEADFFEGQPKRPAVIRHDLGCPGLESGFKWNQMVVEVVARINLVFAVRKVRVFAILLRAAAREVLGHAGDAVRAKDVALKPFDVGENQPGGSFGVFSKRAVDARPTGLGGQVGHRVESGANADRQVFLPGDIAKLFRQRLVPGRGQADGLRPFGKRVGGNARGRVLAEGMARVGRDGHRNAQPRALGHLLEAIVPFGHLPWRCDVVHIEVIYPPPGDELVSRHRVERAGLFDQAAVRIHPDHGVKHQAGLFLQSHLGEQVCHPLLEGAAGILVRVESAILVQVAEGYPFLGEDGSFWLQIGRIHRTTSLKVGRAPGPTPGRQARRLPYQEPSYGKGSASCGEGMGG